MHNGNIIISNPRCKAGCYHCPYAIGSDISTERDECDLIKDINEEFLIISGGEPFELRHEILNKYITMCILHKNVLELQRVAMFLLKNTLAG